MTLDEEVAALRETVAALANRLGMLEDAAQIRALQYKYSYYMDKFMFDEIVDLFAEDAELRFMGGIFRGKAGARRLYGGGSGLKGPVDGILFDHHQIQDIVDVAPDRKRAWGRFRTFMQGGVHETHPSPPPNIPSQFWEGGVYENEYVKDAGVWKFKVFNYRV
ncbi:MAG TPA: nuclear transport factor 2 family protein, partial [Caulobacteraceae bacterium]|nr:nuclear transport factor 2 family protein [Caulobacteraceae bacterium]